MTAEQPKPMADIRDFPTPFLTIGVPVYDDFDGAIFTIMNMRINHPHVMRHVEFILMDDNPGSVHGQLQQKLFQHQQIPNGRYIASRHWVGPWLKGKVFYEARGHACLVMDSHVLIYPGVLAKLIEYYLRNPDTKDILHGPLVYDNLATISTHFHPRWSGQMWGVWATDEQGRDPDNPPFPIWGQGMGLFSARTQHWKDIGGFHPLLRGFGGEEGYIHEKFRQHGGRAMCLPFMRWWHRFDRIIPVVKDGQLMLLRGPDESPYPLSWENKVRNYLIGFLELGIDDEPMLQHFARFKSRDLVNQHRDRVIQELCQLAPELVKGSKYDSRCMPHAHVQQISSKPGVGGGGGSFVLDTGLPGQGTPDLQRLCETESLIISSLNPGVQSGHQVSKSGSQTELDDCPDE